MKDDNKMTYWRFSYLVKPTADEQKKLSAWTQFSLCPLYTPSDIHAVVYSLFSPANPTNQQEIHIKASDLNWNQSKLTKQITMKFH